METTFAFIAAHRASLFEHNNVIEKLSAAGAHPFFGNAILPWASNRADVEMHSSLDHRSIESVLAIEDQKLRR